MKCPVLRADSFRQGIKDLHQVRNLFANGRGYLSDEEGIDWWDLTSLVIVPEAESLIVLQRMVPDIRTATELWTTRDGWQPKIMATLSGAELRAFGSDGFKQLANRVLHYTGLLRRFRASQIKEILLDKYDSNYRFRSRLTSSQSVCKCPVVLLPSAYRNVSRMAAAYARLLPDQAFLLVATRQNAHEFARPRNLQIRDLFAYIDTNPPAKETVSILERWGLLQQKLRAMPEFEMLASADVFHNFPRWFRDGLVVRNAWRQVLESEPVQGVLCGDDSNIYTRVTVLLAANRNIPTVDFHHGALDGRYLFKDLPSDVYLAKNEMERDYLLRLCGLPAERVSIGSPSNRNLPATRNCDRADGTAAIFFSEPYEVGGMRPEDIYGEILPALCRVARENGRSVVVKLHPFESRPQRARLVRHILRSEDRELVTVVDGPLTSELMNRAWFGITIESTTAMDCMQSGVACFLCGWLSMSSYEYQKQYARFGMGEILQEVRQVEEIPRRLNESRSRPSLRSNPSPAADPALLHRWLTVAQTRVARSVS